MKRVNTCNMNNQLQPYYNCTYTNIQQTHLRRFINIHERIYVLQQTVAGSIHLIQKCLVAILIHSIRQRISIKSCQR